MAVLLRRMIVAAAVIGGSAALPTRTQDILHEALVPELPDFGVGFDLTASYGTAAVSFANGTVVPVAKVTADDGYNEVLQQLSLESSQHLVPPYQNTGDVRKDKPREALRSARKAMGMPASQDVGLLAKVLSDLRARVEEYLGHPIQSAGVTTPHLVALYQEDLQDAFEYVGLHYIKFPVRYDVLYETSAAFAGYGYGLCPDYNDRAACKKAQQDMESDVVMAVLYTPTALTVSFSIMKSAYYLYEPDNRHLSNFSLGYDARIQWTTEEEYWSEVEWSLERLMKENPYYQRPAKILLMGDRVRDEEFTRRLQNALSRQMPDVPGILNQDPLFVAAKGAAELAKRIPYDPYKNLMNHNECM